MQGVPGTATSKGREPPQSCVEYKSEEHLIFSEFRH